MKLSEKIWGSKSFLERLATFDFRPDNAQMVVGNITFSDVPVVFPKGAEISKVLTEEDVRRIVREEISKALKGLTE